MFKNKKNHLTLSEYQKEYLYHFLKTNTNYWEEEWTKDSEDMELYRLQERARKSIMKKVLDILK